MIGAVRGEITERRAERATGLNERQWQIAVGPYLNRVLATGHYPTLAKVVRSATHPTADTNFDIGLDYVLDGIAARLADAT